MTEPACYSYTAPALDGLFDQPLVPSQAAWDAEAGSAMLTYDSVRSSADPRVKLLAFLQSSYLAGARTAGWDLTDFATRMAPEPASVIEGTT